MPASNPLQLCFEPFLNTDVTPSREEGRWVASGQMVPAWSLGLL